MSKILLGCILLLTTGWQFSCRQANEAAAQGSNDPLAALLDGNRRFLNHEEKHPHLNSQRMQEIAAGQHPTVAIICCSDSRVPPELIFDQGLGDLFVVRTAGNLMGGIEIGSIEYAVEHLGVRDILVMGHQGCGAVKAFVEGGELPGHIRDIVDSIRAEQEIRSLHTDPAQLLNQCIRANILHGKHQLQSQSPLIAEKISKGELRISTACYDLEKGGVELIRE